MNSVTKCIGILFALFFLFAAYVQLNDKDAGLWVALYMLAAMASILFTLAKLKRVWAVVLAIAYTVLAIYFWPPEFEGVALQDGMKTMNIELGRESLGMGISAVIMLVFALLAPKSQKGLKI